MSEPTPDSAPTPSPPVDFCEDFSVEYPGDKCYQLDTVAAHVRVRCKCAYLASPSGE